MNNNKVKMKKYVKPETKENRFVFDENLAITGDPGVTTSMQLTKERDDELDSDNQSNSNDWTNGLW